MFDLIPDMACKRAEISPDATAFREGSDGRVWTFSEVDRAAEAIAAGLLAEGLSAGDRLAILCLNRVEFFLTLFACQKTGIILCPLNWRQPASELIETVAQVEPRAVLFDAHHAQIGEDVATSLSARTLPLSVFTAWIATGGRVPARSICAEEPWYLLFTSGTTGRAKAVIQTARMCWANAVNIGQAIDLTSEDRTLCFLPLFHTAGINLYTMPAFLAGAETTVLPKFDPDITIKLLRAGRVTQFFGVPAIYQALSLDDAANTIDWTDIRCGCGGAPLPEPLIHHFAARGALVLNGMGMTETGPTVFLMTPDAAETKIGSVGRPQMLSEVRLDGVSKGDPGNGELQIRGPNVTPGYFENPDATASAFTEDGWLKTGDVARRDEDGFYFIVDRIKDMYISGGENVYPAEVERVLHTHPAILESAVIGIPDAKWGEVGAAFVLLRPGQVLCVDDIRAHCRERLAAYKVPVSVNAVDDFPRTAAGKVRKPDLRALLQ